MINDEDTAVMTLYIQSLCTCDTFFSLFFRGDVGGDNDTIKVIESIFAFRKASEGANLGKKLGGTFVGRIKQREGFVEFLGKGGVFVKLGGRSWEMLKVFS